MKPGCAAAASSWVLHDPTRGSTLKTRSSQLKGNGRLFSALFRLEKDVFPSLVIQVANVAPLLCFRSFRIRDEAKGSWAVAPAATTGGEETPLYFDAAVWFSSASSPLL